MKKKIVSVLLSGALLLGMVTPTFAANGMSATSEIVRLPSGNGGTTGITREAYDNLMLISDEEAEEIAMLFVGDMIAADGSIAWDEDTSVTDVAEMYGENGGVTAYAVYLTSGYVIVSAYMDTCSTIPEWADTGAPEVEDFDIPEDGKILYFGATEYYLDTGENEVETVDGQMVARAELQGAAAEMRSPEWLSEQTLDLLSAQATVTPSTASINSEPKEIYNPFNDANTWYRGPFVCNDYVNNWENYAVFGVLADAPPKQYLGHCVPTAVTNALRMYARRYPTCINIESTWRATFEHVMTTDEDTFYYLPGQGVQTKYYWNFIYRAFCEYAITTDISAYVGCTHTSLQYYLGRNALLLVGIKNYDYDKAEDHAVLCYAYTRVISQTTGLYKTYIKTCDGNHRTARYYDLADLTARDNRETRFHAILFP